MGERWWVSGLNTQQGVEVEVEAVNEEEARAKARPQLRARGVPDHDPLVVGRERPIQGEAYDNG